MSYFIVQDWMITKLKLKGLERDVFAIIYGFSPKKNTGVFNGSLDYLAEATGCSKVRVCSTLASLVSKNLTLKKSTFKGNIKYCEYKVNIDTVNNLLTDDIQNVNDHKQNVNEHIQNVNGTVNKLFMDDIQNVNGTVNKMLTNNISYNKERENSIYYTSSPSKVSNTHNNSDSTPDTSELDLFSTELINIFKHYTASEVSSLENVNALKDQAKRLEFLELFNNASGEWREAIKHAKKLTSKSNKIGTLKWLDFLDFLKLLLKNRTVDGVNFISKKISETDKLKLEKEKEERDKQEAIIQAQAELERKLEAERLGISVDELDNYKMNELKKKLLGQTSLEKEVYHA